MNFHVGTSGYAFKEWKGSFYPEDLPANKMLAYYAQQFRTVEINNTFYRLPAPDVFKAWADDVPEEFKFALKAPRQITQFQRLKGEGDSLPNFLKAAAKLKDRQGPLLFGLHPNMKKDAERLGGFLKKLPRKVRVAFEFRHPSWFDEQVFGLLRDHGAAMCIAEADDDLEVPFVSTADWGYLRLRRANYTNARLKTWVMRVREQKWRDVFVFFMHDDEGNAPNFAKRFLKLTKATS